MASGLTRIPWAAPWFEPWRGRGARLWATTAQGLSLHDALNRENASPTRFVPQGELPPCVPYERHIFETGNCPTRPGLHDFFNGLCWIEFPLAKKRLNEIQAKQIAAQRVGAPRGPVRDAATLFDENGALLDAPPEIWDALLAHDWRQLFVTLRPLWREARVVIFGHALLEKLIAPRKALTAHVWHAAAPLESIQGTDAWLAGQLTEEALAAKPFTPLPVLGVPGWWAGNADESFYDDLSVFRPRRAPEMN